MRAFVTEKSARRHLGLHLLALAALAAAVGFPALTTLAGLLLAASYAWLGLNLLGALLRYRIFRDRIPAAAADRGW